MQSCNAWVDAAQDCSPFDVPWGIITLHNIAPHSILFLKNGDLVSVLLWVIFAHHQGALERSNLSKSITGFNSFCRPHEDGSLRGNRSMQPRMALSLKNCMVLWDKIRVLYYWALSRMKWLTKWILIDPSAGMSNASLGSCNSSHCQSLNMGLIYIAA